MKHRRNAADPTSCHGGSTLATADGALAVTMVRHSRGLYVERSQASAGGPRLVQFMRFGDEESFEQWCEFDSLRFSHPKFAMDLRRTGHELFARDP